MTGPSARLRFSAALILIGLGIMLASQLYWTPLTFVVSASVGVGAILLGAGGFFTVVLRALKNSGAL